MWWRRGGRGRSLANELTSSPTHCNGCEEQRDEHDHDLDRDKTDGFEQLGVEGQLDLSIFNGGGMGSGLREEQMQEQTGDEALRGCKRSG